MTNQEFNEKMQQLQKAEIAIQNINDKLDELQERINRLIRKRKEIISENNVVLSPRNYPGH